MTRNARYEDHTCFYTGDKIPEWKGTRFTFEVRITRNDETKMFYDFVVECDKAMYRSPISTLNFVISEICRSDEHDLPDGLDVEQAQPNDVAIRWFCKTSDSLEKEDWVNALIEAVYEDMQEDMKEDKID